jgi:hypothetical protein
VGIGGGVGVGLDEGVRTGGSDSSWVRAPYGPAVGNTAAMALGWAVGTAGARSRPLPKIAMELATSTIAATAASVTRRTLLPSYVRAVVRDRPSGGV